MSKLILPYECLKGQTAVLVQNVVVEIGVSSPGDVVSVNGEIVPVGVGITLRWGADLIHNPPQHFPIRGTPGRRRRWTRERDAEIISGMTSIVNEPTRANARRRTLMQAVKILKQRKPEVYQNDKLKSLLARYHDARRRAKAERS
jgi:hypothetical protein